MDYEEELDYDEELDDDEEIELDEELDYDEAVEALIGLFCGVENGDLSVIDEYIKENEERCDGDIYEAAFNAAVQANNVDYVREHISEIDLNPERHDYECPYFSDADGEIYDLLREYGGMRSVDCYYDYRFSWCTTTCEVLNFDNDFMEELFGEYLKRIGLTEEELFEKLSEDNDEDYGIASFSQEEVFSMLGYKIAEDGIEFTGNSSGSGWSLNELIEDLGYEVCFEGDSWKLETNGYYFVE